MTAPGAIRFVPHTKGKRWGAYDTAYGSFPVNRPETGPIEQDVPTEQAAQTICDRLNDLYREKARA